MRREYAECIVLPLQPNPLKTWGTRCRCHRTPHIHSLCICSAFCCDSRYVAQKPEGPIRYSAPRPRPQHKLLRPPVVLLQSFFEAGRISTCVRNRLGHLSVDHRNIYAQLELETKAQAIARCEPETIKPGKHWSTDKTLMSFLKSLWPSISYVAV